MVFIPADLSNSEDFNFRQFLPQVTVQNASSLAADPKTRTCCWKSAIFLQAYT
ncbi:hypothetical protein COO91_04911 [Nostoc flagelliforme CCNUN1]|uniref:Uncharacterized protein n=1 Tax=Nostoc flagelliforme CCNUN1 TaxID=2038116 RepID=A0A2K8STY8_9NOSO|nr:hypothetical protein COO91_04911 [Nostoc flagelliforme CCNUN1]